MHATTQPRDPVAWVAIPLTLLAYHCATLVGYGIFRDELYYLACADHLAWGYVDHPPLSILGLALVRSVLGDSVAAIRLPAALAGVGTVVLTASIARALGGGPFGQRLASLSAALFPAGIALAGFYSMNALDLVFWASCFRALVAILAGGDPRLWLVFGGLAGLGLQNKISVLFLGFGVVAGLVAGGRAALLRTRWPWLGGALALLIFLPHLLWQTAHGWPTLEFMANARRYKMTGVDAVGFLSEQFLNANPGALPVWLGGLAFLIVGHHAKTRPLGWMWLAVAAVMVTTGAKPYYLAPSFPLLYAAGGLAWERWTTRRWARAALFTLVLVGSLPALPLAKAVLPVESLAVYLEAAGMMPASGERHALGRLPQHFADQHGWKELAATVARVRDTLPAQDRARICIFGQNYGQAGAIDYFGRSLGLPRAVSGHNSYWFWGPGACGRRDVWIVIGDDRETLDSIFEQVSLGAVFECDLCMPYEDNKAIWIARGLKRDPGALWPAVRLFI